MLSKILLRPTLLLGLLLLSLITALIHDACAETVTGCPLGLRKGEIWIKGLFASSDADEYYNSQTDAMEVLPEGWHQSVSKFTTRIGYGLSDIVEVGLVLPYKHLDMRKKEKGEWITKDSQGLEDIWIAVAWKFVDNPDSATLEAAKLGLGFNLDTASENSVKNGIGDGAKGIRVVLLSHEHLTNTLHLCNHIYYDWLGKARRIQGWKKSDWNYGDRIGYKFIAEYSLGSRFRISAGPIGWTEVVETKSADGSRTPGRFYSHSLAVKLLYLPTGNERDHKKISIGVDIPYSAKKSFSPDYSMKVIFMWTF